MNDTDARIRAALSAEDTAYLEDLSRERGLFAQARELYRGPMARWTALVSVAALAFTALGAWTIYRMIQAPDPREEILWLAATCGCALTIAMIKLWAWSRMESLGILRELKVIELRIARLEDR